MKKLKVLPKIFLETFFVIFASLLLIHLLLFFIFPKTYLFTRENDLKKAASNIAKSMNNKELEEIKKALNLYSETSDFKAYIKDNKNGKAIKIKEQPHINMESTTNSLIIEEKDVKLKSGQKITIQFISSSDMHKEAKDLSLRFLPLSLFISLFLSLLIAYLYALKIKKNIKEITTVIDDMVTLKKDARLVVDSQNEVGDLKRNINFLYESLLKNISDLENKNEEIKKLEKMKYAFLKGAQHELKTPLASLKIILENMKYKTGMFSSDDAYIDESLKVLDNINYNMGEILSIYMIEDLKNDEEEIIIKEALNKVLDKYSFLAQAKKLTFNINLNNATIYMGPKALDMILSNIISNAIKYTKDESLINIYVKDNYLCIENEISNKEIADNSHGLGLYIVSNLLKNYHVNYQINKDNDKFIYMIELSKDKGN